MLHSRQKMFLGWAIGNDPIWWKGIWSPTYFVRQIVKWFFLSTKFKTNSLAHGKKLRALSAMGFSIFLSVFLCKPAGLAVHCENLLFHWWAIMAVCISNKKTWVFSVNEIRLWLLESTNFEFFRWTKYAVWVNLKNSRFVDERSKICLSEL